MRPARSLLLPRALKAAWPQGGSRRLAGCTVCPRLSRRRGGTRYPASLSSDPAVGFREERCTERVLSVTRLLEAMDDVPKRLIVEEKNNDRRARRGYSTVFERARARARARFEVRCRPSRAPQPIKAPEKRARRTLRDRGKRLDFFLPQKRHG